MLREEAPSYTVDDRLTFRGGYLLKDFPVRSLTHLPGLPPMGELTAFKQVWLPEISPRQDKSSSSESTQVCKTRN